jgi:TrmH family RNA methyltransferase
MKGCVVWYKISPRFPGNKKVGRIFFMNLLCSLSCLICLFPVFNSFMFAKKGLELRTSRSFFFLRNLHSNLGLFDSSSIISSTTNENVKLYQALINMKKKRDSTGLVVLEGFRAVSDALRNNFQLYQLCLSSSVDQSSSSISNLRHLMNKMVERKVIRVTDKVYRSMSNAENGPGILGIFHKPSFTSLLKYSSKEEALKYPPLILLLDRISDPGNMGTLLRTSYGFGVQSIISVNGTDIWSPKVLRSSTGVQLNLPIVELDTWDRPEDVRNVLLRCQKEYEFLSLDNIGSRGQTTYVDDKSSDLLSFWQVLLADGGAEHENYDSVSYKKPTLLIVGSEAHGVHRNAVDLSSAAKKIKIPMARDLNSLNAAVAGSIILSEAAKQRSL